MDFNHSASKVEYQRVTCHAGVLWDTPLIFHRFIEDCTVCCDVITPHLLAAPFFRGQYIALIIPTGFANRQYSQLLPALRARSERIRHFIEDGGKLLVFGAAESRPDTYDWLPFRVEYHHCYGEYSLHMTEDPTAALFLEGYDTTCIACDGHFPFFEGSPLIASPHGPVLIRKEVGKGEVVVTSIHEYPSRPFLQRFCCGGRETLF